MWQPRNTQKGPARPSIESAPIPVLPASKEFMEKWHDFIHGTAVPGRLHWALNLLNILSARCGMLEQRENPEFFNSNGDLEYQREVYLIPEELLSIYQDFAKIENYLVANQIRNLVNAEITKANHKYSQDHKVGRGGHKNTM